MEQTELSGRREGALGSLQEVTSQLDTARKALNDNETYIQLTNLERKWQVMHSSTSLLKDTERMMKCYFFKSEVCFRCWSKTTLQ